MLIVRNVNFAYFQIVWEPYTEEILENLPYYCTAESNIWTAKVPLICFHIIEWHLPDRVMRQFGGTQGIPSICNTEVDLHKIDLRNKTDAGWQRRHKKYVRLWRHRHESVIEVINGPVQVQPEYQHWYLQHTRRWISRTGATLSYLVCSFVHYRFTSFYYRKLIQNTSLTNDHALLLD